MQCPSQFARLLCCRFCQLPALIRSSYSCRFYTKLSGLCGIYRRESRRYESSATTLPESSSCFQ